MTNEPYYLTVPVAPRDTAPYPPIAPYAPRTAHSQIPMAPPAVTPPSMNAGQLVAAVFVTVLGLFLFLPSFFFTHGVAGVLLVPMIVSITRSIGKGYDTGRTWLRAAIVGLISMVTAYAAGFALLVWALSHANWG